MKQRLIDANKAKIILWGFSRFSGIDEAPYEYADEAIDILPTVEAIPIEWVKEWTNKYCDCYQENLIKCLLKTWEKENGT